MIFRRFVTLIAVVCLSTVFLSTVFQSISGRRLPQGITLSKARGPTAKEIKEGKVVLPDLRLGKHNRPFKEPVINSTSPYPIGKTKPGGSTYTKCLVVARLKEEDTSWIDEELGDMKKAGLLTTAVYVVDDRKAEPKVPKNKGHEAMVYLTYIIDTYDRLPDVSIFMHAHRFAWHNDELLEKDSSLMVRHLSPERVSRLGYMNLRCHWDPGCPDWLHPGNTVEDDEKQEEVLIAESWAELFPRDPIPSVLAQPCCAQFAVSRDRIRALPKERYIEMREWLLETELSDYFSGRVFEYTYQFIFSAAPVHCPSMSVCYCDGYGICFGGPDAFDYWFELRYNRNEMIEKLRVWHEKAKAIKEYNKNPGLSKVIDKALLEVPEPGRDKWLEKEIEAVSIDMQRRLKFAIENGKNPRQRAIEAGRKWHDNGGF